MSEPIPPVNGALTYRDLWEILRLPVFLALIAIAGTWAVWYVTGTACPSELARTTGCNAGQVALYINLEVLNKMVTHAAIAGGGGGLWSYTMITRERRAREALERQLAEERAQAAEERSQAAGERVQAAEERAQAAGERVQAAEERAQAAEERAQAAEERSQAAVERRQLLATIEHLTQRLAERENGDNGQTSQ